MIDVTLSIECDDECALGADELSHTCQAVLDHEGVTRPCAVSLTIVDEAAMAQINARYRGVESVTDVISLECERPDDPDLAPDEPCELGDIVLAPTYIAAQVDRLGTTVADETRLLVVHGMLHLLGYDHLVDDEAQVMESVEDEICAELAGCEPTHVRLTRHGGDEA